MSITLGCIIGFVLWFLVRYLVASAARRAPSSCTGGAEVTLDGSAPRTFATSAPAGTALGWRVCPVDLAGNVGTGRTGTTTPLP